MELHEIFDAAADLIEHDGWWDGRRNGGRHCVRLAVVRAAGWDAGWPETYCGAEHPSDALAALRRFLDVPSEMTWNDSRVDGAEVVNALRKAAEAYRP